MESAGHIGNIDMLHDLFIRTELPSTESLAHIRVDLVSQPISLVSLAIGMTS